MFGRGIYCLVTCLGDGCVCLDVDGFNIPDVFTLLTDALRVAIIKSSSVADKKSGPGSVMRLDDAVRFVAYWCIATPQVSARITLA